MSPQRVDVVRRWLEALSEERFDDAIALVHPDVVFVPPGGQAPHRGAEALRRWMEPDAFVSQVVEPLELTAAGEGTVLARHRATGRGRASGLALDVDSWSVWTFGDDGLVTRIEVFLPHEEAEARRAAGLEPG